MHPFKIKQNPFIKLSFYLLEVFPNFCPAQDSVQRDLHSIKQFHEPGWAKRERPAQISYYS